MGGENRVPSLMRALKGLLSPSGFPYASNGVLFRDGEFGRDSLETAEDLLDVRADVAHAVILRLAELQGARCNPGIGEMPGKIHHEYRAVVVGGRPIGPASMRIFRDLAREWHIAESDSSLEALTELVNYFTVDATPLYVRLVARYCSLYGDAILDKCYTPRQAAIKQGSGANRTVRDSVRAAVEWVAGSIERSDIGLLEWERRTPWEHRFQAWKDGGTSYLHADGSFANYNGPIAAIEVQGLAHDALRSAAALLADAPSAPLERYGRLADVLRDTTLERFWMPDLAYFAMALDRDPASGQARQVRTMTSNGAALLDSGLLDGLTYERRSSYVLPVVKRIFSGEFLTAAGVRCTSLLYKDLQDYPAYQSSYTVWHKETYDIAKGLRRQGFPRLAAELERRLLNTVNLAGPKEFVYVLPDGRVDYGPARVGTRPNTVEIAATNHPESDQAWTVAAALTVKWRNGQHLHPPVPRPYLQVEENLLRAAGLTQTFRTITEVERARPTDYQLQVNVAEGHSRERAWVEEHALPVKGEPQNESSN